MRSVRWTIMAAIGFWGGAAAAQGLSDEGGIIAGGGLYAVFQRGGVMMWPILVCSIVGLAYALERLVAIRQKVIFPPSLLREARKLALHGRVEEAANLGREDASPFGKLLYTCLSRADASAFEMEAALEEAGSRILYDLRRNTRPLGIVADIAPLLGLMGTVTGMIGAFEVVAKSGALGRTELLAAGIAEALLTTIFGLCVCVPALVAYHFLRGKAEGILRMMEDACLDIMNDIRRKRKPA